MSRGRGVIIALGIHCAIWCLIIASALGEEGTTHRGEMLYLAGDYADAASLLKEALKVNPDDVEALFLLALSLYELGEDDKAKANLKLAHEKLSSQQNTTSGKSKSLWRSLAGTPLRGERGKGESRITSLNPALIKFPPGCKVSVFKGDTLIKPDLLYSTTSQPVYALRPGGVYRIKIEPGESAISSKGLIWIAVSAAIIGFLAMR